MAGCKRDRKKESFWRRMVGRQAASGSSVRGWCREHGLAEYSFYAWRRELARRDAEAGQPVFVPVRVAASAPTSPERGRAENGEGWLEIRLAGERCVRIQGRVDRQTLSDVLVVLASADAGFGSEAQVRGGVEAC